MCMMIEEMNTTMAEIQEWKRIKEEAEDNISALNAKAIEFLKEVHMVKPNKRIATAFSLEANLGLRISDILQLRLSVIIRDGNRYRLDIVEQKTKKKREFTVPIEIYSYIQNYALENNINPAARLFDISERTVQNHLQLVCG